jgi:hypothetical protein
VLQNLFNRFAAGRRHQQQRRFDALLTNRLRDEAALLNQCLEDRRPRVMVVKQDVNEDLYCCPPETDNAELIRSTLLRTGPVALFTELGADFRIVETVDDPECQIWQERATILKWDSLEFFSSYRDRVPGRQYGQARWAVSPDSVDWNQYDIVVSMDVCVPQRITRNFPKTLWCYYVREIKAPSYQSSLEAPARGQDIVFNHYFRDFPAPHAAHVLEFPYHLHRPGCFHKLFGIAQPDDADRDGVFVDHHTMVHLDESMRSALDAFGPVVSTIHGGDREIIPTSEQLARRTMDDDLRERLLRSRFFLITPGARRVFGTALVEAIAAGCLAIGSPDSLADHGFFFTSATSACDAQQAIGKMNRLVQQPERYLQEVHRQRQLVEYLCYVRPLRDLLRAWHEKVGP